MIKIKAVSGSITLMISMSFLLSSLPSLADLIDSNCEETTQAETSQVRDLIGNLKRTFSQSRAGSALKRKFVKKPDRMQEMLAKQEMDEELASQLAPKDFSNSIAKNAYNLLHPYFEQILSDEEKDKRSAAEEKNELFEEKSLRKLSEKPFIASLARITTEIGDKRNGWILKAKELGTSLRKTRQVDLGNGRAALDIWISPDGEIDLDFRDLKYKGGAQKKITLGVNLKALFQKKKTLTANSHIEINDESGAHLTEYHLQKRLHKTIPGIVEPFGERTYHEDGQEYFSFSQELHNLGDLNDVATKQLLKDDRELAKAAIQMITPLLQMHKQRIVFLDSKPANYVVKETNLGMQVGTIDLGESFDFEQYRKMEASTDKLLKILMGNLSDDQRAQTTDQLRKELKGVLNEDTLRDLGDLSNTRLTKQIVNRLKYLRNDTLIQRLSSRGTAIFQAPEVIRAIPVKEAESYRSQIKDPESFLKKGDTYSFGLTLHQLKYGANKGTRITVPEFSANISRIRTREAQKKDLNVNCEAPLPKQLRNYSYDNVVCALSDPDPKTRMSLEKAKELLTKIASNR
jgi:serine/threonine protein kinase